MVLTLALLFRVSEVDSVEAAPFAGEKSSFHSYDRYDLTYDGRTCIVVTPRVAAEGKPWIWRALEGKANCARLTISRCICDPVFSDELMLVLRQYGFAVIHFNNSLHGIAERL